MAARTMTESHKKLGTIRRLDLTCTCDSTDGSFAAAEISSKFQGTLMDLKTNPGATAPTDNYDIVINDADGYDILEGVGANRHTTTTQKVPIVYSGTAVHPVLHDSDTISVVITNNSVNSAVVVISLYYVLGGR